jgi:hypothetical protein
MGTMTWVGWLGHGHGHCGSKAVRCWMYDDIMGILMDDNPILALELGGVVREEADLSRARLAGDARARAVARQVQQQLEDSVRVAEGEPTHAARHRTGADVQVTPVRGAVVRTPHREVGMATRVAAAHTLPRRAYEHNVQSWALWFGYRCTLDTYTQNASDISAHNRCPSCDHELHSVRSLVGRTIRPLCGSCARRPPNTPAVAKTVDIDLMTTQTTHCEYNITPPLEITCKFDFFCSPTYSFLGEEGLQLILQFLLYMTFQ